MAKKSKNDSNVKLVQIEGMKGVYTTTGSHHSTGSLDFNELANSISNPLVKTQKRKKTNRKASKWPVVEKVS